MDLVTVRMATAEDAAAALAMYRPYVEKTAITFEYAVPSEAEFRKRMVDVLEKYPYIVAEKEGCILGYAYASAFKGRAAYDWAVETSIYVDENIRGLGLGKKLYEAFKTNGKNSGSQFSNWIGVKPYILIDEDTAESKRAKLQVELPKGLELVSVNPKTILLKEKKN